MKNTTEEISTSSGLALMTQGDYVILLESCYGVWLLMGFLGVVSNVINIRVFVVMGLNDGVTISFLALAIFDLAYLIATISLSVSVAFYVSEAKITSKFHIDPFAIMVFSANIMIIINIANILTTTFLAVVRCLCVAKPLQFKNTITKNRATLFMAGITIFSVTIYIPILANMGMTNTFDKLRNASRPSLWMSPNREIIKKKVWMVTDMFLPIVTQVVILVCVVIMVQCLRAASKFRQSSGSTGAHDDKDTKKIDSSQSKKAVVGDPKELRVVQQVVLISVVYIVCNVPKIIITFCTLLEPEFTVGRRYTYVYLGVNCLRKYFEIVNAAVNFIIYFKYNTKFRSILGM